MTEEFQPIEQLCVRVTSGATPSRSNPSYWDGGDIPWMKTGEIKQNFVYGTGECITRLGLENSAAKMIPANSVIVALYGDGYTAGSVAINKIPLTTNQACCNLIINDKKAHYGFVYYYLKGSYSNLVSLKSGGSQQNLNGQTIKSFPILKVARQTQCKIAAILTAYDDLIETNKRRIALLEKMAEELYREWFVRMRFPGHQTTKFVKGVPEGWEVRELKECADINPSSIGRNDRPEMIHYVDIGSVTTNQIGEVQALSLTDAPGRARRRVKHGDIIWSSVRPANRAYCLIYKPIENLIVSTGFAVIRPKSETPFTFLNFVITSNGFVDQMTAVAKGAAYPATSFDDIEKAKLLWPGKDLLGAFHDSCEPLFHQKHTLTDQSLALTKSRNLLLPRLISGKLSVEDLDIQFPPSMAESSTPQSYP